MLRALISTVADIFYSLIPAVTGDIRVPRVHVGHDMVAVAGGVVFHDARGIELFSLEIGVGDASLGPGAEHRSTALVAGGKTHGERTVGL